MRLEVSRKTRVAIDDWLLTFCRLLLVTNNIQLTGCQGLQTARLKARCALLLCHLTHHVELGGSGQCRVLLGKRQFTFLPHHTLIILLFNSIWPLTESKWALVTGLQTLLLSRQDYLLFHILKRTNVPSWRLD